MTFCFWPLGGSRGHRFVYSSYGRIRWSSWVLDLVAWQYFRAYLDYDSLQIAPCMCTRLHLLKYSCKQSCGAKKKCPSSCLFILFHLTLGQQTTPPSCLNIFNSVSTWMAWSCFQNVIWTKGVISYPHTHPIPQIPPTHTYVQRHTPPFPPRWT